MAFPGTIPADGTRHTENGVRYIVRSGRWEKERMPVINTAGMSDDTWLDSDNATQAAGKDYFVCRFNVGQHEQSERLRVQIAFQVDTACYPEIGFWSRSINNWLPKAHFKEHDGLVRWADTGNGMNLHHWEGSPAWSSNAIMLPYPDNTRKCQPGRGQHADISLVALNEQSCLLTWRFNATCVTNDYFIFNTARSVIDKPLTDLTAIFLRVTEGKIARARTDVEIF